MIRQVAVAICIMVLAWPAGLGVHAQESDAERRKRLEGELQTVERQIMKQQRLVESKRAERQSLERDVEILEAEINKAQLGIRAREVAITQLSDQIGEKEEVISILNERLETQRQSLADLIRKTNEVDDFSMVEVLLSNQNLSEFFSDFESFRSIKESLNELMGVLEGIKRDTQEQRDLLEEKQQQEAELKQVQEIEKNRIEQTEEEKEQILEVTKGEEEAYQQMLESQKRTAAQIRAELFDLLGGGGQIPLTEAIDLARTAGAAANVPPSLILAILQQETELGRNIGGCTMNDMAAGQDIMHPERDKPVFMAIANTLGFDPQSQPVSCPLRRADGSRIGWGGAMGPSQFIPSTWAIYGGFANNGNGWEYNPSQDEIRSLLGKSGPGNPFRNVDAFTATALLLRDNGANGSYAADRRAALRYYAGWGGADNPENQFYGDRVMQRKAQFESDISTLQSG